MSRVSEWRAKAREAARAEAVELELPSGAKILARRPDPVQMAAWGKLPMLLAGSAAGGERTARATNEEVAEIAGLYRDLLVYCCVEPQINPQAEACATDEEIHPREIPEADWRFIIHWALRVGEARALESFRGGRTDGGGGGDGEGVRAAAVIADGDRGPGAGFEF
jgi:hypothetical protein